MNKSVARSFVRARATCGGSVSYRDAAASSRPQLPVPKCGEGRDATQAFARLSAAAPRTRRLNAASSRSSPSYRSIARRVVPLRLALKIYSGSSSDAPCAKVSFDLSLYDSPVHRMPSHSHTGTPRHFQVSSTSGTASWMSARTRASTSPASRPIRERGRRCIPTLARRSSPIREIFQSSCHRSTRSRCSCYHAGSGRRIPREHVGREPRGG